MFFFELTSGIKGMIFNNNGKETFLLLGDKINYILNEIRNCFDVPFD